LERLEAPVDAAFFEAAPDELDRSALSVGRGPPRANLAGEKALARIRALSGQPAPTCA